MKTLFLLALASIAIAQTPATLQPPVISGLDSIALPAMFGGGGAYNQFSGSNLFATAIYPVSNKIGMYAAATADLFPVKTNINGKAGYIFQMSTRASVHKVMLTSGKNIFLFGVGGGYAFGVAANTTGSTSGISGDVTFTYVRQLTKNLSIVVPIRALYMPSPAPGWNPLAQFGFLYTTTP